MRKNRTKVRQRQNKIKQENTSKNEVRVKVNKNSPYRSAYLNFSKGQSVIITHTILLSFVIFMIFAVANAFLTLREEFQNFAAKNEIDKVCLTLKSGTEKLFSVSSYRPQTTATSKIDIKLPEKIADIRYSAKFQNASIIIETLGPAFNSTCHIGFNATYKGSASGGLAQIILARNSTKDLIEMRNV